MYTHIKLLLESPGEIRTDSVALGHTQRGTLGFYTVVKPGIALRKTAIEPSTQIDSSGTLVSTKRHKTSCNLDMSLLIAVCF